ncbi:MAG: hypothetical protein CO187_04745 [Zetaproteobacteria bacterium CG_4_9_14_3_um_filter_53_7]|nr:MAG: hypothetical protein CO187_04745 [Zetaproteobacteria bacterium CG_4_9_14_3_um_filter_53_7]
MRKFKWLSGLILFWASWLLWGLFLLLPFVSDADAATTTMVATGVLVVAEVSFFASLLLLGKPFYQAFKARLKPFWLKVTGRSPEVD